MSDYDMCRVCGHEINGRDTIGSPIKEYCRDCWNKIREDERNG